MKYADIAQLARATAVEAAALIRRTAESTMDVQHKGRIDLVTTADRAAETYILQQVRSGYPEHGILAEEAGHLGSSDSRAQWIVDPLDGTTNFAHGFPYWSVSIAWAEDGQVQVGAVADASGRCYWAVRGEGAWCDEVPLQVSVTPSLEQSLLVTGFSYTIQEDSDTNMAAFERLTLQTQGVRRTGSAALDLCMVASGALDAYWERYMNPWDLAAGTLIVEEAGGRVSDADGAAYTLQSTSVLASNGLLHQAVAGQLR